MKSFDYVTNERTSAAAFGRSVGIRNKGRFLSLANGGHTPVTVMPHLKFGTGHTYVSSKDIEAFHKRSLTPTTMAAEFDVHWRTLSVKLQASGVTPFAPNGENFGAIYLREDVETAFR